MSVLVFSLFFGFLLPLRNILVCGLDTLSCECVCVHGPVLSRVYFLLVPSAPRIDLNLNDKKNLYFIVSFSKYFCYNFSSGVFFFFLLYARSPSSRHSSLGFLMNLIVISFLLKGL